MKKTTKILLVLAAVVAMTIGAVSTVMAADYPTIGVWGGDATNGYTATDADGNAITRGWATENGLWYYFESGKMVTNSFITSEGQTYYLGDNGQMHTGWAEFKSDKAVTLNKIQYSNVYYALYADADAFDYIDGYNDSAYKTLWIYCDENGALQTSKWVEAYGLWYYMDGAFCITDEWSVALPVANGADVSKPENIALYGFGKDANMHVNWVPVTATTAASAGANAGTPYEGSGTAASTSIVAWVYYDANGKQVNEAWEKIGSQWCYFVADATYGTKLVTNTLFNDGTHDFYVNADGYMVTGAVSFAKGQKISKGIGNAVTELAAAESYYFDTVTGSMKSGEINGTYYKAANDTTYAVGAVATGAAISFTTSGSAISGCSVTGDFFVVTTAKINNVDTAVAMYYEAGKLVKDEAITLGAVTFIIDANGYVVNATKDVTVDGVTYKVGTTKLTVGDMEFVGVVKK